MTLAQLLTWLHDRYWRVVEFFDTLYWKIRNAALHAYEWAVAKANDAYNRAVAWAVDALNTASGTISSWVKAARQYALDLYNSAYSSIIYWKDAVVAWAQAKIDEIIRWAENAFDDVREFVLYWFQRAADGAAALVNGALALLRALEAKVLVWLADQLARATAAAQAIVDGVAGVLNASIEKVSQTVEAIRSQIGGDNPETQGTLLSFITSPFAFLAAYVAGFLVTMFCDLVAQGMGTLHYDLPPPHTWGPGGTGGPYPVGPGPEPGASGLSPPLSRLWISGYVFGPGHPGIDLGVSMGDPVYAMHDGQVLQAGWNPVGYGYDVVLQGGEWWTRYAHLQQPLVALGDQVKQRSIIGLADTTGNSTGPHLHLEIKYRGAFIDPATVLFG